MSPKRLLHLARSHWGIENQLYWGLDVHFAEDGTVELSAAVFSGISKAMLRS
jgi:hypothetical protein